MTQPNMTQLPVPYTEPDRVSEDDYNDGFFHGIVFCLFFALCGYLVGNLDILIL